MTKLFLKENHLKILKDIFDSLCPNCAILAYGSRIKNEAHDGSDLDLAIINNFGDYNISEIQEEIKNSNLPFLVDIFEFSALPQNFQDEILKENVVIYNGKLKPQIRFKGFDDAWEQRKFEDVFQYERPDKYIVEDDKYTNTAQTPVLTANKAFILGYTNENNTYNNPSIIFDDFTLDCKYVDFPYMVKSSAIKILTIKNKNRDNLQFAYELLNAAQIEILGHARHYISVVQPTLTLTPSKTEQDKISLFFSKLDNLITLHQRKYEKLKNVKKSMLEKMFPKNNSKFPEIRFKGFTDAWEQRKLGDITNSYSGGTPSVGIQEYYGGEIPFIRSAEINSEKTELYITKSGLENSSAKFVEVGDILYALYGATSGEVGRAKLRGAINQAILAIKPISDYDAEYIMQWLRNSKKSIINTYLQGGQGNLSGDIVKNLTISVPTKDEQTKIGAFFSKLDNLITLHQRKCEKLKNIKKSMLEKMFV